MSKKPEIAPTGRALGPGWRIERLGLATQKSRGVTHRLG